MGAFLGSLPSSWAEGRWGKASVPLRRALVERDARKRASKLCNGPGKLLANKACGMGVYDGIMAKFALCLSVLFVVVLLQFYLVCKLQDTN